MKIITKTPCPGDRKSADKQSLGRMLVPAILLAFPFLAANAADLQVLVYEKGGDALPVRDAAVCLGPSAKPDQLGSGLTDNNGKVTFTDVPAAPLVLTVSKSGYKSDRRVLSSSHGERIIMVSLPTGGGGPACEAGIAGEGGISGQGLALQGFRLDNGNQSTRNRTVTLSHSVQGSTPTHYRASETPGFDDVVWKAYVPAPRFQLSDGPGNKTVYFQIRRHSQVSGARLQSLSSVREDSIVLK